MTIKLNVAAWFLIIFMAVSTGVFWGNFIWEHHLEPTWICRLPGGGYIYIEDGDYMWIRHNSNSWNGTLDYQITLNPIEVKEDEK